MASNTGRPADENLPEVVWHPPPTPRGEQVLPEVVPDSSPEAAQQRYFAETDKYPAYYDNAPKLPHDGTYSPGQEYYQPQQRWVGAEGQFVSAISPNSSVPWQSFPDGDDQRTYVGSEPAPEPEKRICGLRKRLFIIIAAIVGVVVVAAAVGGGVGGAMASKGNNSAAAAETSSASSSASSSISATSTGATRTKASSTSSTSSAATPTISFLNNQTDPSTFERFAFQAYSGANMTGKATPVYRDEGFYDFGFNAVSYIWLPNNTNCCITYCESKTKATGYWCDLRRRNETSEPFPRLSIWCGRGSNTKAQTKCS
ncbi:hypothetical protein C8A05DRAFT_32685 [Staphylotrichum tortipilum]|uniref:Uncharacterized protein n=1 Tax=Staphylotrichum tortipilum TaxID=2831512 RepID=A0AAN6MP98_9PEZI|nr:hypothetical protein C8A05DRAFT_32685 [Staphylotrichum longicolle]